MFWSIVTYLVAGIVVAVYLHPKIGGGVVARWVITALIALLWAPLLAVIGVLFLATDVGRWIERWRK